jgi:hypothetical protein
MEKRQRRIGVLRRAEFNFRHRPASCVRPVPLDWGAQPPPAVVFDALQTPKRHHFAGKSAFYWHFRMICTAVTASATAGWRYLTAVLRYASSGLAYAASGLSSVTAGLRYASAVSRYVSAVSRYVSAGFESLTVVSPSASLGAESPDE